MSKSHFELNDVFPSFYASLFTPQSDAFDSAAGFIATKQHRKLEKFKCTQENRKIESLFQQVSSFEEKIHQQIQLFQFQQSFALCIFSH